MALLPSHLWAGGRRHRRNSTCTGDALRGRKCPQGRGGDRSFWHNSNDLWGVFSRPLDWGTNFAIWHRRDVADSPPYCRGCGRNGYASRDSVYRRGRLGAVGVLWNSDAHYLYLIHCYRAWTYRLLARPKAEIVKVFGLFVERASATNPRYRGRLGLWRSSKCCSGGWRSSSFGSGLRHRRSPRERYRSRRSSSGGGLLAERITADRLPILFQTEQMAVRAVPAHDRYNKLAT
jgi:hypothetical protein